MIEATHFIEVYKHWGSEELVSNFVFEIAVMDDILASSKKYKCTTIAIFKIKYHDTKTN